MTALAHHPDALPTPPLADPERVARALRLLEAMEVQQVEKDRVTDARHEAGHAVMALELGVPVHAVTIAPTPEKGWAGHCLVEGWHGDLRGNKPADMLQIEQMLMVLRAGEIAERLGGGAPRPAAWEQDRQAIEQVLRSHPHELHTDERQALLNWCELHTLRRLSRAWPAVISVAMELVLETTITQARLLTLYEASLAAKPPFPQPVCDA